MLCVHKNILGEHDQNQLYHKDSFSPKYAYRDCVLILFLHEVNGTLIHDELER